MLAAGLQPRGHVHPCIRRLFSHLFLIRPRDCISICTMVGSLVYALPACLLLKVFFCRLVLFVRCEVFLSHSTLLSLPSQAKTAHPCEDFHHQVLETNLPSLSAALVAEAMWAARHIVKDPATRRGGPWSFPKPLTESQLELVREVSKVRVCKSLVEISERDRRSALYRHLCSLNFGSEPCESSHLYRGMFVRTSSRSGTPGNLCRSRKIFEGRLVKGSRRHKRSHRGVDVKGRRAQETTSRKPR